jgi:hypothetical protein
MYALSISVDQNQKQKSEQRKTEQKIFSILTAGSFIIFGPRKSNVWSLAQCDLGVLDWNVVALILLIVQYFLLLKLPLSLSISSSKIISANRYAIF